MFTTALEAAKKLVISKKLTIDDSPELLLECLPDKYSLEQLYDEVVSDESESKKDDLTRLLVVSSSLQDAAKIEAGNDDEEHTTKLLLWISSAILPDSSLVHNDDMPEDPNTAAREQAITLAQHKGIHGLKAISSLQDLSPKSLASNNAILLSIIAFTSPADPWTTATSRRYASEILSSPEIATHIHSEAFIIRYLLQSFIRPLFSASKPDGITAAGRKAMPSSAPRVAFDVREVEKGVRPWKYDAPHAITVFIWAIQNSSKQFLLETFHLYVPPLLTLLDTSTTSIRVRALAITPVFLSALTPKLLSQTGLGSVFEDTLLPILLYLPTLTPVEESIQLLPPAYEALFTLCSVRFTSPSPSPAAPINEAPTTTTKTIQLSTKKATISSSSSSSSPSPSDEKDRIAFLDRLMRRGILTSYLHASTHPEIVTILLAHLQTLTQHLGMHVTKHLQHVLAMLDGVLSDPFGTARPALLLAATRALQMVVRNAWPRLRERGRRVLVLRMLVLCWKGVEVEIGETESGERGREGEGGEGLQEVRRELEVTGRLLLKAVEDDESVDLEAELKPLVQADESLGVLFGVDLVS